MPVTVSHYSWNSKLFIVANINLPSMLLFKPLNLSSALPQLSVCFSDFQLLLDFHIINHLKAICHCLEYVWLISFDNSFLLRRQHSFNMSLRKTFLDTSSRINPAKLNYSFSFFKKSFIFFLLLNKKKYLKCYQDYLLLRSPFI